MLVCINETTFSKESSDSIPQKSLGWGGKGLSVRHASFNHFQVFVSACPSPRRSNGCGSAGPETVQITQGEGRILLQHEKLSLRPSPKQKKMISLSSFSAQLQSPPKAWSLPRLNMGLLSQEEHHWEAQQSF